MVDLAKLIKAKPVSFPPEIKIHDLLKDLLKKMLVPDVKRRISWSELFSHPITTYLDKMRVKEVDLELAEDESLMMNTSKYYLKNNLVINQPEELQKKS
jgi:serine/threonine protein kinase